MPDDDVWTWSFTSQTTEWLAPYAIIGIPVVGLGSCGLSADSSGTLDVYVPAPPQPNVPAAPPPDDYEIGVWAPPYGSATHGIATSQPITVYAEGDEGVLPADDHSDEVLAATWATCPAGLTFYDATGPSCRFDICDPAWSSYPDVEGRPIEVGADGTIRMGPLQKLPRPTGSFRVRPGKRGQTGTDYDIARTAASAENAKIRRALGNPRDIEIHELKPVKFGGSPTDVANKWAVENTLHRKLTTFFNRLKSKVEEWLARQDECPTTPNDGVS